MLVILVELVDAILEDVSVVVALSNSPDCLRFRVSPLAELISALHVLDNPSHHPHADWARKISGGLPPHLIAEREWFGVLWGAFRASMLIPRGPSFNSSLSQEIDFLSSLPKQDFVESATHALRGGGPSREVDGIANDPELQRRAFAHARARGKSATELLKGLIEDPSRVQDRLCFFLTGCDIEFFRVLWKKLAPALIAEARQSEHMKLRYGAAAALKAALPTAQKGAADNVFILDKAHDGRIDLQSAQMIMTPTVLGRPHVIVKDERVRPAIQYPIIDSRERARPPLDVQRRRLIALSDAVRLQLCRDISREARSTLQLAERWRLDPAVISRHLKVLREANLVEIERHGHFVLYRLTTSEVAHLGDDLLAALLR